MRPDASRLCSCSPRYSTVMSDLNLGPAHTSNRLRSIFIAVVVLTGVGAAVFLLNPHKTAELSVTRVQLYDGHANYSLFAGTTHVVGSVPHTEDDLYVVISAKLANKLRLPLFVESATGSYTAADGSQYDAEAVSASDLGRLEQSFPDLTPMLARPLNNQTQVAPGQTAEGEVLLHFSNLTQDAWKARKSATLTINLAHQDPQTTPIP